MGGRYRIDRLSGVIQTDEFSSRSVSPVRLVGAFSVAECNAIRKIGASLNLMPGEMLSPVENYRNSSISFFCATRKDKWLDSKLLALASIANERYGFELCSGSPTLQYTRYDPNGKIEWHDDYDCESINPRKISITVQLSKPTAYDGGALEFFPAGELALSRGRGTAILFPSFLPHRISEVTSGLRESLVAWFSGPAFR